MRVYYNKTVTDKDHLNDDVQETLADLIVAFNQISDIKRFTGREIATVIT